jgi:2-keto-4-pentenoate hydratase
MSGDSTLLAVAAIQEASVEVRILTGGELAGPIRATVPTAGRTIIPVSSPDGGGAIEISSNTPISVEGAVVVPDVTLDVVPAVPTVEG